MSTSRKHPPYEAITARWGGMDVRYEFGEKIEKWLSAFELEDRPLLLELLDCFLFYSEKRIREKVIILYQLLKEKCPDVLDAAVFTKPIKDYGTSFSSTFFISFWLENHLKDQTEENVIGLLSEDVIPPVLVIVDDYSGSGQTIIKTINRFLEENSKVNESRIIILLLALSEDAGQAISRYSIETGLSLEIISLDIVSNAFKTGFVYSEEQAQQKRIQYSKLYDRFLLNPDFRFGFLDVASLIAFHYNTPNNTLGLFWQDLSGFCALFPRHKNGATILRKMQAEARNRRDSRRTVIITGVDEGRRSAMLAYCVAQESSISLENMQKDFGLTIEQLGSDIKTLLDNGYLEYIDNKFVPTAKLKSHMFVRRMKKAGQRNTACSATEEKFDLHTEYIPLHFD